MYMLRKERNRIIQNAHLQPEKAEKAWKTKERKKGGGKGGGEKIMAANRKQIQVWLILIKNHFKCEI